MKNIFIVPIEPLDNRYTKQWYTYIPSRIKTEFPNSNVVTIDGESESYNAPTAGAFLNFTATCEYKASQAKTIAQMFNAGTVKDGDLFFFTDAWNQTVHFVKYMAELTGTNVTCVGIWHAGWYDPTDILGFTIKNTGWVSHLEMSMYEAFDLNFFGTKQHQDKFFAKYTPSIDGSRAVVAGYPLDYLVDVSEKRSFASKENVVVFPHRLNDDKAPFIFDFIKSYVNERMGRSDIKFIKTQELNLSKDEYYKVLSTAKVVFSANKHENLGISTFESMMLGAYPFVPDKLSYHEMYPEHYKYKADETLYTDQQNWELLALNIIWTVDSYTQDVFELVCNDSDLIFKRFFSCDAIMSKIKTL